MILPILFDNIIVYFNILDYVDINTEYKYAIGFAYAVELLMIYMEDQDYALYLLEQFIKLGGYCPEDIMYKLDNLGLTIGKRVAEYKLLLK